MNEEVPAEEVVSTPVAPVTEEVVPAEEVDETVCLSASVEGDSETN